MYDKKFKEMVKIAVEKLKDESVLKLLQADASYQKDSKDEGYAEDAFAHSFGFQMMDNEYDWQKERE